MLWLTTLCLALSPAPALAREQAVREALSRDADLLAARAQLGVSEGELLAAEPWLPANPELEGHFGSGAPFHTPELRAGVTLTQTLEVAGQRGLRRNVARARLDAARLRLRALELRTARDAADVWWAAWRADRLRELAQSASQVATRLREAAEARLRAGDISELERNSLALDESRALAALHGSHAEAVRARAELARMLGRAVEEPLADEPTLPLVPPDSKDLAQRPELLAATLEEEAAAAQPALVARSRVPNPTLALGWERETRELDSHSGAASHDALTLRLAIPLPAWDRSTGALRAAEATRAAARFEREAAFRRAAAELASALAAAQAAFDALAAFERTAPQVDANLALVERGVRAGQLGVGELLAARDRALLARRESIEARASYGRALEELRRASGRLPQEVSR